METKDQMYIVKKSYIPPQDKLETLLKYGGSHECYKSQYYFAMCEKYPRFRHLLPDHPEPPVNLLPCPFCCGESVPWFTCNACYGAPGYFVRCADCGAKSFPEPWGVGAIYPPEEAHTITEREALEKACRKWNQRPERGGGER